MILSMYSQVIIFFCTILIGMAVAFLYDIFRTIRLTFNHKQIYINLEDIIYWILSSFAAFYIMLKITSGEIRLYSVIGIFLGMIIYFIVISNIVVKVLYKILNIFIKYIKIILIPIRFLIKIYKLIISKLKKLFIPCKKYIKAKKINITKQLKIIKRKI